MVKSKLNCSIGIFPLTTTMSPGVGGPVFQMPDVNFTVTLRIDEQTYERVDASTHKSKFGRPQVLPSKTHRNARTSASPLLISSFNIAHHKNCNQEISSCKLLTDRTFCL